MKSIKLNSARIVITAGLFLGATTSAHAQLIKYNSQAEIYGAAAAYGDSGRPILKAIIKLCSQFGDQPRSAGEKAFADWELRHQAYFEESARIKKEFLSNMQKPGVPPAQKQFVDQMYAVSLPKMVDAQIAAYTAPIDAMPSTQMKASLCMDYAQSVAAGKWDLKTNDPVVSKFFDDRLSIKGK